MPIIILSIIAFASVCAYAIVDAYKNRNENED